MCCTCHVPPARISKLRHGQRFLAALFLCLAPTGILPAATLEGKLLIKGPATFSQEFEPPPGFWSIPDGRMNNSASPAHHTSEIVIFLEGAPLAGSVPRKNPKLVSYGMVFSPAVLPIQAGATVDFHNRDLYPHELYLGDGSKTIEIGTLTPGEIRSHQMTQPGTVLVRCRRLPHMKATILVLPTPHFTRPTADGLFTFHDLPLGRYQIKVWTKGRWSQAQEITISQEKVSFNLQIKAF